MRDVVAMTCLAVSIPIVLIFVCIVVADGMKNKHSTDIHTWTNVRPPRICDTGTCPDGCQRCDTSSCRPSRVSRKGGSRGTG